MGVQAAEGPVLLHRCNEKALRLAEFLEIGDSSGAIRSASDTGGWLWVSKGNSASLIRALVKTLEKLAMKKSLIALAALAATASFAQSSVTISGAISVGVMDAGGATDKAVVSNLGGGANAINIVTVEDLGGGLKGGFDSQIRFSAATGDRGSSGNGNALFHGANAYLSGGFGTVRVGKIIENNNCGFDPWACTGGAGLVAGATGSIGGAGQGLVGALTIQNAVSYATPTIMGFSANYQTSVSALTTERQTLSLNYANGPLAAQVLLTDGAGNTAGDFSSLSTATMTPLSTTGTKAKATAVSASYDFGVAKVSLINAVTKNASDVKTNDITSIGATIPMGAYSILAGYSKDKGTARTAANDTKMALGVNYALSKRTTLGADVFKQEQVGGNTGFVARIRHNF